MLHLLFRVRRPPCCDHLTLQSIAGSNASNHSRIRNVIWHECSLPPISDRTAQNGIGYGQQLDYWRHSITVFNEDCFISATHLFLGMRPLVAARRWRRRHFGFGLLVPTTFGTTGPATLGLPLWKSNVQSPVIRLDDATLIGRGNGTPTLMIRLNTDRCLACSRSCTEVAYVPPLSTVSSVFYVGLLGVYGCRLRLRRIFKGHTHSILHRSVT